MSLCFCIAKIENVCWQYSHLSCYGFLVNLISWGGFLPIMGIVGRDSSVVSLGRHIFRCLGKLSGLNVLGQFGHFSRDLML